MNPFLCPLGHVATRAELMRRWHDSDTFIDVLRRFAPNVYRPRHGLYTCSHLDEDERLAAFVGGRLDCCTVLHRRGLLPGAPAARHIRLTHGHARAAKRAASVGAVVHWRRQLKPPASKLAVALFDAFAQARRCLPPEQWMIAFRAALRAELLTHEDAIALLDEGPASWRARIARYC